MLAPARGPESRVAVAVIVRVEERTSDRVENSRFDRCVGTELLNFVASDNKGQPVGPYLPLQKIENRIHAFV